MNERIRELAKAHLVHERYTQSVGEDLYEFYSDELERFAQLIVKECMDQVRDEVQYITDYDKADQVVNVVKKHFGVEQ